MVLVELCEDSFLPLLALFLKLIVFCGVTCERLHEHVVLFCFFRPQIEVAEVRVRVDDFDWHLLLLVCEQIWFAGVVVEKALLDDAGWLFIISVKGIGDGGWREL